MESLQAARRVKIDEKKIKHHPFQPLGMIGYGQQFVNGL